MKRTEIIEGIKVTVISKSRLIFCDYIALHWLVPKNELPKKFRGKIPLNEIWMRDNIFNDRLCYNRTMIHERAELARMFRGMTYKKAHKWAEMIDGFW